MKRVGKALLHLWHTNGHMGRIEFTRKLLSFGILVFLLNSSLVMTYYQLDHTGRSPSADYILWSMLLINLITVYIFSRLVGKRINDVRGHVSVFSGSLYVLTTALPYAGIYLVILLCRKKGRVTEQHHESVKEWSLLRHTFIAILLPILIFAPLRYNNISKQVLDVNIPVGVNLFYSTFYDVSDPLIRYLLRTSRTAAVAGLLHESCLRTQKSCLEYSLASLRQDSTDVSSSILHVAVNSLQIFKKLESSGYSNDKNENQALAVLELLNRNIELIKNQNTRIDQFENNIPYGVYLISGVIQVPMLELYDRYLEEQFLKISLKKLQELADGFTKGLGKGKLSESFYNKIKEQLELLNRELEILTNQYDYLMLEIPRGE